MAARRRGVPFALFALAMTLALAGCSGTAHVLARPVAAAPTTTVAPAPAAPPFRLILWAKVPKLQVFDAPNGVAAGKPLPNPTVEAQPLAFLAVAQQPDWYQVLMPVRPNSATGWIRAADVRVGDVPAYRVLVEVAAHRLTLFKGDETVMQESVGTGKAVTPTPLGHFYVDAMVKLSNPNTVWGPYQMSVSGFSTVLDHFGGGVGQIAIHGTNAPQLIPGDISNGCVRMHNAAITKLATLTGIGTPVDIVA